MVDCLYRHHCAVRWVGVGVENGEEVCLRGMGIVR